MSTAQVLSDYSFTALYYIQCEFTFGMFSENFWQWVERMEQLTY